MYVGILAAGVYVTHFVMQSTLVILIAILVAFAALDGMILSRIHRLELAPIRTASDLRMTRDQMKRLSRIVFVAGGVLGLAFVVLFAWMVFRS